MPFVMLEWIVRSVSSGPREVGAIEQLTQYGILGIVTCVCFAAIMKLSIELQRVNEARITEAREREAALITVIRESTAAQHAAAVSSAETNDALGRVLDAVRELSTESRSVSSEVQKLGVTVSTLPDRLRR